jgi:hypothetical protein
MPSARVLLLLHRETVLARRTVQPYQPDLVTAIDGLAAEHDPGKETSAAQDARHAATLGAAAADNVRSPSPASKKGRPPRSTSPRWPASPTAWSCCTATRTCCRRP